MIYNNVQTKILDNSYSSFMGYALFEVQTGSMSPEIEAGDWIVVKHEKNYELKDIVTFEVEGEFVTHRVINKYGDTFVTQGDANNAKDAPITKEQIVGKTVKILPSFGIMKKTIFNPVVLIGLIVILYLTVSVFKKKADDHEENEIVRSFDKVIKREKNKKTKTDVLKKDKIKVDEVDDFTKENEFIEEETMKIEEVKGEINREEEVEDEEQNE